MQPSTTPSWLEQAEKEAAAEQAKQEAQHEKWAADIAKAINDRLAELEIVPLSRALTDGTGNVIPAVLLYAVPSEGLFEVHAAFDEETCRVTLLGAAHDSPELVDLGLSISQCSPVEARRFILGAHRVGPPALPPEPAPLSPDAAALVGALQDIHGLLEDIYRHGIGQY